MTYRDPFEEWWDDTIEAEMIEYQRRLANEQAMQDWWDIEDELLDEAQAEDDEIRRHKYENRRA